MAMDRVTVFQYRILLSCRCPRHSGLPIDFNGNGVDRDERIGPISGKRRFRHAAILESGNRDNDFSGSRIVVSFERNFLCQNNRLGCRSGNGVLYPSAHRLHNRLLLGNCQGAGKSSEASFVYIIFPADDNRSHKQIQGFGTSVRRPAFFIPESCPRSTENPLGIL